jgi:hypothetical protein
VPTAPAAELQPAVRGEDGWVTVRLTRLVLPPLCCDCGTFTSGTQALLASSRNFAEHIQIPMPICPRCQSVVRSKLRKPSFIGLGIGLLVPVGGLSLWLCLGLPDSQALLLFLSTLGISWILPLGGYGMGQRVGMRKNFPARLGRYNPKKGTLAIYFRNPKYAEAVMAAMNGPEDFHAQRTA